MYHFKNNGLLAPMCIALPVLTGIFIPAFLLTGVDARFADGLASLSMGAGFIVSGY